MTEKSFINTVKAVIYRSHQVFLQKFQHLLHELSTDPKGGFFWWILTHSQQLALEHALEQLRQESRKPEFKLEQVTLTLLKFKLKKDDAGQAQWYQDAHNKLVICQTQLEQASVLKLEMIKPALAELRFISEADQFHQYFQLQPLQRRVRDMYESIIERMDILLLDIKSKNLQHKKELDIQKQVAIANRPHVKASIGSDGLIDVSPEQHMNALLRQINDGVLDRSNPKVKKQLQSLLQAIAGL